MAPEGTAVRPVPEGPEYLRPSLLLPSCVPAHTLVLLHPVRVLDCRRGEGTGGSLLGTLATYSNLYTGVAGVYAQKSLSLAAWRGQTARVQFRATTDSVYATSFRGDDVFLP